MIEDERIAGILEVRAPTEPALPLIFDSPHSGTDWPADFAPVPERYFIDRASDLFVDRLFEHVTGHGATFVKALFPRTYIDANRAENDLDPRLIEGEWTGPIDPSEKSRLGKGLIWRLAGNGQPIYRAPLPADAVVLRIEDYYRPYHARLEDVHTRLQARYGEVWHINCHSMKSVSSGMDAEGPGNRRADIVLSDREGDAADRAIIDLVRNWFEDRGLRVAVNEPFKGAEILRRHGRPDEGRHAIQIEINRALYMDEVALEPHQGLEELRAVLEELTAHLASWLCSRLELR